MNSAETIFGTYFGLPSLAVTDNETEPRIEETKPFPVSRKALDKAGEKAADIELIRRAASRDIAAFEEIYNRHQRRIFSLCLRMTQNAAESEDLTQEVFIQLFRKLDSFRGDSAFSTWLHRMAVNQVLMHFRKRIVRYEKTVDENEMPEQIVFGTEHHNKMKIVDRIALDKAISQLPKGYKTIFILHDVEGFEHEEIARMMNLATGTSKSQLHKARLKLRSLLASG
jgi:RNA polymerase sigma-70 factor, ECF subfamily